MKLFIDSDYTKIVVIGGLQGNTVDGNFKRDVEVVDLAKDRKTCSSIPDYPLALYKISATFYSGKLVACGGFSINVGF